MPIQPPTPNQTKETRLISLDNGANTTALGVTSKPAWTDVSDAEITSGASRRRLGKSQMAYFTPVSTIVDFDGTNDFVTIPFDSSILSMDLRTTWTIEGLCVADTLSSTRPIWLQGVDTTTHYNVYIFQDSTSGGRIVAKFVDSALATVTLSVTGIAAGATVAWMVTRNGSTVTLYANGSSSSGTLASGALQGSNNDVLIGKDFTTFYDGGIDFIRVLSTCETSQRNGWCRLLDPFASNVLADYIVTLDANNYALDRSFYENHGTASGSPATNRSSLALNPDPVEDVMVNLDTSGRLQGYCVVGDRVYPFKV